MTTRIPICIAVEDSLSEGVLRRLFKETARPFDVSACYSRGGFGYLKSKASGFNNAAKAVPFVLFTDLDRYDCAPSLIADWLPHGCHRNLVFRVAVREVEAWLLADRQGLAGYFRVNQVRVPRDPESLIDAKAAVVALARRSTIRAYREDVVPQRRTTVNQGPNYNARLLDFVNQRWNVQAAASVSDSLRRTVDCLMSFTPGG